MDFDDISARLTSIQAGAEPPRPACVDPQATWRVPIGSISIRHHDQIAATINEVHMEQPGLLMMDDYLPQWTDETITCPSCGTSAEITVQGRWGEPSTFNCPSCNNEWALEDEHTSVRLLQHAIVITIERNGVPAAAQAEQEQPEN